MPLPISSIVEVEALSGPSLAPLPVLVHHTSIFLERHQIGARLMAAHRHVPIADPEIELPEFGAVTLGPWALRGERGREQDEHEQRASGWTSRTQKRHGGFSWVVAV